MNPNRSRYQGALQILRYNLPFYVATTGAAALAVAAAVARAAPPPWRTFLLFFAFVTGLLTASSLLVSHYVYDRSGLFRWDWLRSRIDPPGRFLVIHAGLDEASPALRQLYPQALGDVLDIYDSAEMPQASIDRARRITPLPEPARPASYGALPVADGAADLAMLFFVAHELRQGTAREKLFREVRRSLRPGGQLVLVEHLRDLPNLLAFGPGFLHFLPRAEWLRLPGTAALSLREECPITPFVRAFFLERAP